MNELIHVTCFIIPALSLVMGLLLCFNPPRNINRWWGYRSRRSMSNQQVWDYAQKQAGMWQLRFFILHLLLGIIMYTMSENTEILIGGLTVQTILMCMIMPLVERQLKQNFKFKG